MTKIKVLTVIVALISSTLAACQSTDFVPKSTVQVITRMSYPEFPDIEPISSVNLIPWKHDVPRDMTKTVAKNTTECQKVLDDARNETYWNKCGEHPIITDSNIFVGFDQENWNIILENFAKLREQLFRYQKRIEEVNSQRQQWRKKAEEARQQATEENVDLTTKKAQTDLIARIKEHIESVNRRLETDNTVEQLDDIFKGTYYAVQFGSYKVEENAYRGLEQFKQKAPIIFKEFNVGIKRVDLGPEKGILYGLRTEPMLGRTQSNSFCKSLKDENIDCYVLQVTQNPIDN